MNRTCEDCGTQIPTARLAAVPKTTRCLPCQTAEERDHPPKIVIQVIPKNLRATSDGVEFEELETRIHRLRGTRLAKAEAATGS